MKITVFDFIDRFRQFAKSVGVEYSAARVAFLYSAYYYSFDEDNKYIGGGVKDSQMVEKCGLSFKTLYRVRKGLVADRVIEACRLKKGSVKERGHEYDFPFLGFSFDDENFDDSPFGEIADD